MCDYTDNDGVIHSCGGNQDLTDLEDKTQNILLSSSAGNTNMTGNIFTDVNVFTADQELVTKKYVDDNSSSLEVGTLATMLAKTGMTEGTMFYLNANLGTSFTSQENKICIYSGRTWQCIGETVELQATTALLKGQVLKIGTTADFQVIKTTTDSDVDVIGVVAFEDCAAGDWITVAMSGIWEVAVVVNTYDRNNYLKASGTDGYGAETVSEADQPFCKILENRTTIVLGTKIWALLHTAETY